jgi:hypothetical protein
MFVVNTVDSKGFFLLNNSYSHGNIFTWADLSYLDCLLWMSRLSNYCCLIFKKFIFYKSCEHLTRITNWQLLWQFPIAGWTLVVPLIFFKMVELHCSNRVMQQFGYRQYILIDIDTSNALHAITHYGRNDDYN